MVTHARAGGGATRRVSSLDVFERHPGRTFAAIGCLFAIVYLTVFLVFPRSHGRIIDGDAIQYYAYLRSLAIDRDVDFTNEYQALYGANQDGSANIWLTSRSPIGRPTNVMSIGPALLWSPFFLIVCGAVAVVRATGGQLPLDGLAPAFQLSVGVAGIAYASLGAYLCYLAARLIFPTESAFWAALVAWLATPAIYYSLVSPSYSHATSLFACALFCYGWLRTKDDERLRRYALLGLLGGIAALVRWQDIIVLLLPGIDLLRSLLKRQKTFGAVVSRGVVLGGAAFVMLLPQLIAWYSIYGEPLLMPQGQGFMQWTRPAMLSVLFSTRHGLFTWTPAVLVAAIGLVHLLRRDVTIGGPVVLVLLIALYVNAAVFDWWAGEAFGARRFVSYTVFFALGMAAIFSGDIWLRHPVFRRWIAVAAVAYNALFLLQYQLFMRGYQDLAPYPTTMRQILLDRLTLPWYLLKAWLS